MNYFSVEVTVLARMTDLAEAACVSRSELMRQAVDEFLGRFEHPEFFGQPDRPARTEPVVEPTRHQ